MTNERISEPASDLLPRRGEVGFDPVIEEEDNQDLGGLDAAPEEDAVSVGETQPLGRMEVEDEASEPDGAALEGPASDDAEIQGAGEADRPL